MGRRFGRLWNRVCRHGLPRKGAYHPTLLTRLTKCRRFPIVSGIRVEWDSRLPPGNRVKGIWIADQEVDADGTIHSKNGQPLDRNKVYRIVTRDYMASGHDGYEALKDKPYLIDDENGVIMSTIVRRYLLGQPFHLFDPSILTRRRFAVHPHIQSSKGLIQIPRPLVCKHDFEG